MFAIVQLSIRSFKSDNINNRKNKEQVSSLYKEGQINKKNPHVVKTFLYFRECLQIQISVHTKKTTEDKTRLAPWRKKNIVLLSEKYGNNKQRVSVVIYKCATERIQWKMLIVTKSSNRGMLITKCITCSEHNLILNVWCNKSILWHSHGFTSIINKLIYMIVEYLTNIKRSHGIFFIIPYTTESFPFTEITNVHNKFALKDKSYLWNLGT